MKQRAVSSIEQNSKQFEQFPEPDSEAGRRMLSLIPIQLLQDFAPIRSLYPEHPKIAVADCHERYFMVVGQISRLGLDDRLNIFPCL
jgi:hypothetical protein